MQRKVPRMTRGHYVFIADVIAGLNFVDGNRQFIAEVFADKLAATNPRFKRDKFIARATVPRTIPKGIIGSTEINEYLDSVADDNVAALKRASKKLRQKMVAA